MRIPADRFNVVDAIFERYATEEQKSGRPKNQRLVESIDRIRLATRQDFWTDTAPFPEADEEIWWEVWLPHPNNRHPQETRDEFAAEAQIAGLLTRQRYVTFPDRVVVLVYGALEKWATRPRLFFMIAELRAAKLLMIGFADAPPAEQAVKAEELLNRIEAPPLNAPAVCLLDSGIASGHPLIRPALREEDAQAVVPEWGAADNDYYHGHGTTMAGIGLYGDLQEVLASEGPILLTHRLESVKILPNEGANDPELYGSITQEGVARAEVVAPDRKRAVCLAITADGRDGGLPSSWSSAIDQMAAGGEVVGEPKLVCVSSGNLRDQILDRALAYPFLGDGCGVEDPAQAWNALTVGAMTEKVWIEHPDFDGYQPIAPPGDLSPTSRTSLAWPEADHKEWPLKPDVVEEGGNWATAPDGSRDSPDDLGLLTTIVHPTGRLFTITRDTSPATARVAGTAARIWSEYPDLSPESVRGLIVHSARWTNAMVERFPGDTKGIIQRRLRCYGYGRPDVERALYSAGHSATMIYEGSLQPFKRDGSDIKSNEFHLHALPWPVGILEDLQDVSVRARITLSYFVEPSPGRRGWTRRHRYASHGLRFEVKRTTEKLSSFLGRISDSALEEEPSGPASAAAPIPWVVGSDGRTRGSIHSDWFELTGAEMAECGYVAVYPVTGWWRERRHLERYDSPARYSLIVSLETNDEEVELYNAIAALATIPIEIER